MSIEGSSKAATARVNGVSPATVGRWTERAAQFAGRFFGETVRDVEATEIQADELRGYSGSKKRREFVFAAVEVSSRLWLAQRVGGRTKRNCRLLVRETRHRCALGRRRILITTDPFKYYAPEVRKSWGPACVHVESGKLIRGGRIVRVRNTLVHGVRWQLDEVLERCVGTEKPNTAYIERLNLTIRRALAALHRRTNNAARSRRKLGEAVTLLQCYYNFVRPHSSLRIGGVKRTPAWQAELVKRRLTWRDVFMAFRPVARLSWLANPDARAAWGRRWACAGSNS